ncbi:MAG: arabinose transporter [Myxococcales bacterium]
MRGRSSTSRFRSRKRRRATGPWTSAARSRRSCDPRHRRNENEESASRDRSQGVARTMKLLVPIVGVVFVAFLVTGVALPVLPLHIQGDLGLGTFIVGLVAGAQFGAALLSRFASGNYADTRGAKRAVVIGLLLAAASGIFYLASLRFLGAPATSAAILLAGRGVLGAAESFIVTGALAWGLGLLGAQNTGKIMSWVGLAMYVAFAVGAPVGTALYARFGFISIALATGIIPLVTLALVAPVRPVPPSARARPSVIRVVGAVSVPGVGLAFTSAGFAALTTFSVLLFTQHRWPRAWLPLTVFAVAFVIGRAVLGHLPDRIGGVRVALVSAVIEAAGLLLIWIAATPGVALAGAMLAGFGYTLVYPAFGVEAVRRAPVENRGLATGAYTAFLDLALGLGNPALGLVAGHAGVSAVFLVSAIVVLGATIVAIRLLGGAHASRPREALAGRA